MTPYTYTEDFTGEQAVLSRDNLKISFAVHTVWRVDERRCRSSWSDSARRSADGDTEKAPDAIVRVAYAHFVREPLRTFARDEVQRRNGLEVKDELIPIGDAVLARIRDYAEAVRSSSAASSWATCSIRRKSPTPCRASWRRRRS